MLDVSIATTTTYLRTEYDMKHAIPFESGIVALSRGNPQDELDS